MAAIDVFAAAVACDLIPLAVLKLEDGCVCSQVEEVACDLIPLAVLKQEVLLDFDDMLNTSHVTSYRLRFVTQKREPNGSLFLWLR